MVIGQRHGGDGMAQWTPPYIYVTVTRVGAATVLAFPCLTWPRRHIVERQRSLGVPEGDKKKSLIL